MPDDVGPLSTELLRVDVTSDRETVISVEGELDGSDTAWFGAFVSKVLENGPKTIAIDAAGLSFMDSSGLRCLLLARAAAIEAGVAFQISAPSPVLRHMAERTGLRGLLLDE